MRHFLDRSDVLFVEGMGLSIVDGQRAMGEGHIDHGSDADTKIGFYVVAFAERVLGV